MRKDDTVTMQNTPLMGRALEKEVFIKACAGYLGHLYKKSLFDNDDSALQAPFVRTDVLSSQYSLPPLCDEAHQY
jgi:hypothetical protein